MLDSSQESELPYWPMIMNLWPSNGIFFFFEILPSFKGFKILEKSKHMSVAWPIQMTMRYQIFLHVSSKSHGLLLSHFAQSGQLCLESNLRNSWINSRFITLWLTLVPYVTELYIAYAQSCIEFFVRAHNSDILQLISSSWILTGEQWINSVSVEVVISSSKLQIKQLSLH